MKKKKCCHVRMLSSNKSCSKDNLDGVIDVQQYNPLIHQQLRESKIQAVTHIYMRIHVTYMLPPKGNESNPQSCFKLLCNTT